MEITIMAAQHGNELLGMQLVPFMISNHPSLLDYCDVIVGNPEAYDKGVRYIESDLNRSYAIGSETYEQRRANEIKRMLDARKPGLVVDFHTTNCEQPDIHIVGSLESERIRRYLGSSSLEHVLLVQPMNDITTIGFDVVAYEIPNRHINDDVLEKICGDMMRYIAGQPSGVTKKIFQMTDKIMKSEVNAEQIETLVNFEPNALGFVPVLVGENSYKAQTDYLGFKAQLIEGYEL